MAVLVGFPGITVAGYLWIDTGTLSRILMRNKMERSLKY